LYLSTDATVATVMLRTPYWMIKLSLVAGHVKTVNHTLLTRYP